MFSCKGTSPEPGFAGAGLALESVVMGLGPGFLVHRAKQHETTGVSLASESMEPPKSEGAGVEPGLSLKDVGRAWN